MVWSHPGYGDDYLHRWRKNVTGGVLAGEAVSADLVGGDANLIYCGAAIDNQTNLRPLLVLRWVEMFS